jgi:hypothetical protein
VFSLWVSVFMSKCSFFKDPSHIGLGSTLIISLWLTILRRPYSQVRSLSQVLGVSTQSLLERYISFLFFTFFNHDITYAYLGYIVTLTKFLRIYHYWIHPWGDVFYSITSLFYKI